MSLIAEKIAEFCQSNRRLAEQQATKAQTFILSKERFPDQGAAGDWIEEMGLKQEKIDETENAFRFRQFEPVECREGTFRTIDITDGVQAVVCRLEPVRNMQDAEAKALREAGKPLGEDGSCPAGYPTKRRDPETGEIRCFRSTTLQEAKEELAESVRKAREEKGISLEDVAKEAGVSASSIGALEQGEVLPLDGDALEGIGRALDMDADALKRMQERALHLAESHTPSGAHSHPHEGSGSHGHIGLEEGGMHVHAKTDFLSGALGGGHRHTPTGPIDGFHLEHPEDDGGHQHVATMAECVPEIWGWVEQVIAAHHPRHLWLPGHVRTWIQVVGADFEPRIAEKEGWTDHFRWVHSSGMHEVRHRLLYVGAEDFSPPIRKWYEFEDGTLRPAMAEDFAKEAAWFDQHLPFPIELFQRAAQNRPITET